MATINGTPNVNNYLVGTDGDDFVFGANFNDYLLGQKGNDTLSGGTGRDHLYGGAGDDVLQGGDHQDHLEGGKGNDYLDGGAAVDVLTGGYGHDTFHFQNHGAHGPANTDRDVITDFSCDDVGKADGYGNLSWDSAHANIVNKAGFAVVHLEGHEGDTITFDHAAGSLHWEWHLT